MSGPAIANPEFDVSGAGVSAIIYGGRVKPHDADEGASSTEKTAEKMTVSEAHNWRGVEVSGRLGSHIHTYVLPSSYTIVEPVIK